MTAAFSPGDGVIVNIQRSAALIAAASLLIPAAGSATTVGAPRVVTMSAAARTPAQLAAIAQRKALIAALQKRVKYVFVLYQENRSFDSYFGTFPGADGLFSRPRTQTPGFVQQIQNVDGSYSSISPFRIGPEHYAADTDDVNHSHPGLVAKIDVTANGPQMDKFALAEEALKGAPGTTLTPLQIKQYGELTMAYEDCDTIPLLWNYANRFTLFDHIFQSYLGPSTPGNLTIIGAQAGETQAALHPNERYADNGSKLPGVPVLNDLDPAFGPYDNGRTDAVTQLNLTYATLPITLAGPTLPGIVAQDANPAADLADVRDDIGYVAHQWNGASWGWFQEGYRGEPLKSYISHHNGPQYFGYIANNVAERANLHGLGDFFSAVSTGTLPRPGVFYVKGGYQNIMGLKPVAPFPAVQTNFAGDDDHPGYSDAQISEALVAESVNRIVKSRYWNQSAIIITYDDSEGDYDHVPPPLRSIGPGVGNSPADFLSDGPRVPLIVISPFAKDHRVEHAYGDQGSVVKFIDHVFGLTALSDLPDEQQARLAALIAGKANYGPDDGDTNGVTDLLSAFDPGRLNGTKAPIAAWYASVPEALVYTLPQTSGIGCRWVGVKPVDRQLDIENHIPSDFNPRPATVPTQSGIQPASARKAVSQAKDPAD
jgi:phospholipase C